MSYFAAVLIRASDRWHGAEADLADCESLTDLEDVLRDHRGDVRLLVIEQDDEYAALLRLDGDDDEPRAFLSDGHAADAFKMAAIVGEDLEEIGGDELEDDEDAPLAHDSAPFGDPDVVEDLGVAAADLLAMCAHPGTLPVDLLVAVCDKAGCGEVFEDLRG
jgi:putative tRNA adenosine deaminase-associated protein